MKNLSETGEASLDALAAFVRVAQLCSFSKAARQLGVTPSALSHSLRQVEEVLGTRLLNRTTRSVTPTDAGQLLLQRLPPALQDIQGALREVRELGGTPSGTLRLNVPRQAARLVLAPLLAAFHARCPKVLLEIVTDDRMVDIVRDGFDAGIRFGGRVAADMVALPLRPAPRFLVVATPAYLDLHGRPKHPRDLAAHACINRRFPGSAPYAWEFAKKGQSMEVPVNGPLTLDDDQLVLQAALDGMGLAYVYDGMVGEALSSGRLECVLQDWCPQTEGFYLYYSSRRHVPAALRELIRLLQASS